MILCDGVAVDPDRPLCIQIDCLISTIRSIEDPPFPVLRESICVLLCLTACRGEGIGEIKVVCEDDDSDLPLFGSPPRRLLFAEQSPLDVVGIAFRLNDCMFPKAGPYTVQFWYNGRCLCEKSLTLR